jgi:hypothetical protein
MKDIGFSYILGFSLYELIGLFGGFTVSFIDCKETLVNCYLSDWTVLFVELSISLGESLFFRVNLR